MFTKVILKLLRLPYSNVPLREKGFVLVLIDGLGYKTLSEALRKSKMPFLKGLENNGYCASNYFSGIQAKTNVNEAELFYGKSKNISNFVWYDRKLKMVIDGMNGASLEPFEKYFLKVKNPLLAKGSCVLGIYDGGATLSEMAWSRTNINKPLKTILIMRLFLLPFVNPKIAFISIQILIRNFVDAIINSVLSTSFKPLINMVEENFLEIIWGEYTNYIASMEFFRNTPILFINLTHYDSFSHLYRYHSKKTFDILKLIDRYCKYIFDSTKNSKREYEVIFFSDHGQTPCVIFDKYYKTTLLEFIRTSFNNQKNIIQSARAIDISEIKFNRDILLLNSDSIAHIYFPENFKKPMTKDEILVKYPLLLKSLLAHAGIGWLIVKLDSRRQILLGKNGNIIFENGKIFKRDGEPFSKNLDVDNKILSSLAEFATYDNNGDIVLLGNVIKDKIVCFEDMESAHGGVWGEALEPFVFTKNKDLIKKIKENGNYKDVYEEIRNLRTIH